MKFHLLLFVAFLISEFTYSQTCIIVVKRRNDIFVAADSRRVNHIRSLSNRKENDVTIADEICKILHYKNIYFSISGISDSSVLEIAYAACHSKNIHEAAVKFRINMVKHFYSLLTPLWKTNPSLYQSEFTQKTMCQSIFYGMENNSSYWVETVFSLRNIAPEKPIIDTVVSENPPFNLYNFNITVLGKRTAIDRIEGSQMLSLMKNEDLTEPLLYLIREQIKRSPDVVGEPIDVLQITSQGQVWKIKKQSCN